MNRQRPPSRMSISRVSVVKPSGPNQRVIWLGSVKAWNTRERGAAITRDSTISRSSAQVARGSWLIVFTFRDGRLWGLRLREKALQPVEPRFPGRARVIEPARRLGQALGIQAAGALLAVAPARDQPSVLQYLQVLRHRRQAHGEGPGNLLHGHVAFAGQSAEDRKPSRVAKGREGVAKHVRGLHVQGS